MFRSRAAYPAAEVVCVRKGWLLLLAALIPVMLSAGSAAPAPSRTPERMIWIETDRKPLTVYEDQRAALVFPIASGAADTPSPLGVFRVVSRFETELSGFGTRFLGLNVPWGQYGIHGTSKPASIGQNASHGCIRLSVRDAETLYRLIPNGTRVVIEGGPFGPLNWGLRPLREGDRGADVYELQRRLMQRGLLGNAYGVFGPATRQAVRAVRQALGLPPGDQADPALQRRLGMAAFE